MRYTAPRILYTKKADDVIRGTGKINPLEPDNEPPHHIPQTVAAYGADE
jgi:hypothetical protein